MENDQPSPLGAIVDGLSVVDMDRNEILSRSPELTDTTEWPTNCKYFIPQLMDADHAIRLFLYDACYLRPNKCSRQSLNFVDIPNTGTFIKTVNPDDPLFDRLFEFEELSSGGTRMLFIPQRRHYFDHETTCDILMKIDAWFAVLRQGQIPPNAVELLHENNGGFWEHLSFCHDNAKHPCSLSFKPQMPCAYHLCAKLFGRANYEHFFYARHDFHTNTNFVLVMGTVSEMELIRLCQQFDGAEASDLYCILLNLTTTWAQQLESIRWDLDFGVQDLESKTDHSGLQFEGTQPLPPEKLSLRKEMAFLWDELKGTAQVSAHLEEIFGHLSSTLDKYQNMGQEQALATDRSHFISQLQSAICQRQIQQRAQAAQIRLLIGRVDTQWNIVASLVSQHNNELNQSMARTAGSDSAQMRRLTTLATIFLPPTFMATFFSMEFFHIEDKAQLRVDTSIWVYFTCTFILTVLIVLLLKFPGEWPKFLQYSLFSFGKRVIRHREQIKEQGKDPPVAADVGVAASFRHPGDARKLRDRSRMRHWMDSMKEGEVCVSIEPVADGS